MRRPGRTELAADRSNVSGQFLLLLTTFLWFILASAGPASAGETDTFRLEPHPLKINGEARRTFSYSVRPGSTVTDAVRLTNKTEEARRFRVYAAHAQEQPETGAIAIAPHHAEPQGVASWVEIQEQEIALLPGTSEVVEFSLTRPPDITSAGAAAIVAEEIRPQTDATGIELALRVAIMIDLTGDAAWLQVAEPTLDLPISLVPRDGVVSTTLTNGTLQPIEVDLRFEVESLTGQTWSLPARTVLLAPQEELAVSQEWETVPRWGGAFRATADAEWEAGTVTAIGVRSFFPPLWLLALAIVAVGIRGLREMWTRRRERRALSAAEPAPNLAALRERLIEAALWLHGAGRDAPLELREATIAESEAIAAQARRAPDGRDLERAARSLAEFARNLDDEASARQAAGEFDAWFREHRDDPRVKELVGS